MNVYMIQPPRCNHGTEADQRLFPRRCEHQRWCFRLAVFGYSACKKRKKLLILIELHLFSLNSGKSESNVRHLGRLLQNLGHRMLPRFAATPGVPLRINRQLWNTRGRKSATPGVQKLFATISGCVRHLLTILRKK
jgi:hypothetical protein